MSTTEPPALIDRVKDFLVGTVWKTTTEIQRLIPDSILFGSLLMFFLTHNISFGVFGIFMFEMSFAHSLISWATSQTVGPSSRPIDIQTRPGFRTPQFKPERMFARDSYPTYSIFSLSAIAAYLGLATLEFSSTMDAMSTSLGNTNEWSGRKTAAFSMMAVVLVLVLIMRIIAGDSLSELLIAFGLAIIVGVVFFYINKQIFGIEAMNFLGLPYAVTKESEGSTLYVCAAEDPEKT
jgi:hypothetical protein